MPTNEQDLANLGNGFIPVGPLVNANIQQTNTTTVTTDTTRDLVKICDVKTAYKINNLRQVNFINGEFFEDTITNNTAETQDILFSYWLGAPGRYQQFNQPASGFDQPAMVDDFGNQLQKLQAFNILLTDMPVIVNRIELQADSSAQANQRIQLGWVNKNIEIVYQSRLTSFCDPCFNQNNPDVFSRIFNGPIALGKNIVMKYPVLAGATITIRLILTGSDESSDFTSAGGF